MKRIGCVTVVFVMVIISSSNGADRFENTKPKGVYLSFGLGGAEAAFSQDYWGTEANSVGAFVVSARSGFVISRDFLIGIESMASLFAVEERTWQAMSNTVALTFYPTKTLFFRGGVGFGTVRYERNLNGPWDYEIVAGGAAIHAAVGLDFPTSKTFSILPTVRWDYVNFDPESYYHVGLVLDIGWHW